MNAAAVPPKGFRIVNQERSILIARSDAIESLQDAGLDRPEGWERLTTGSGARAGRGATAILELPGGSSLRLKQLRRGGALGPLCFERFAGARRLLDNLRIPLESAGRGVLTPAPYILLLVQGPPGLFRGWLGTEEIDGASDLVSCFSEGQPPEPSEFESTMALVRQMHDVGLDHRDLNLGNLLLQRVDSGARRAWVCDLDGARLLDGPLGFGARQHALRRLERSYVKLCMPGEPTDEIRDGFYRFYAAGDPQLAARLAHGRGAGRGWILLHRLGWRR